MDKDNYLDYQNIVQELLRQVRKEHGLRQRDVAQHLSKPQSFVSKYESGERMLDIVELREVCIALGISLVDFIKRFEELIK